MTSVAKNNLLYEKFGCPPLNLDFIQAQRRRLCFRNERSLYVRNCDITGERIISVYSPDKPFIVYKSDYWYGDEWDPLSYGQDFDFSKSFFEQFATLHHAVPRLSILNQNSINSDYCNMTVGNKNCYLIFGGDFNEDCMYGTLCMHNTTCFDLDYSDRNTLCYQLSDSFNCYGCQFVFDSKNCNNCYFVSNCSGSTECILSTNLVQKSYCIENKQYSKEEYFKRKQELLDGSATKYKELFERFLAIRSQQDMKFSHMVNCENCTGDYLKNSKNCTNCFDVAGSEDLTNVIFASKVKDAFECSLLGEGTELAFNTISSLGSYNSKMSFFTIDSNNIEYSKYSISSENLFGCIGLQRKKYCILNKQYSEGDYKNLHERIIQHMQQSGEWGAFFPQTLSDFAYNETSAQDYFPLKKEDALAQGYMWKDEEERSYIQQTISLPDNISDVDVQIVNEVLQCELCKKNYRILEQEISFYKNQKIPFPRLCDHCRHEQRMNMRNPRQLWKRTCSGCSKDLESSYSPDRSEKIFCEDCYLKKMY